MSLEEARGRKALAYSRTLASDRFDGAGAL